MAAPVSVSLRVCCSSLLPLWETLQDQEVGVTQDPFKLLLLF